MLLVTNLYLNLLPKDKYLRVSDVVIIFFSGLVIKDGIYVAFCCCDKLCLIKITDDCYGLY